MNLWQAIETNTRVYIIMEEANGGNLLTLIQEQKRIPEKQSAIWFRQMCDAIDYCHQQGVVHRDLKCENLLLDHKVTPIIMSPVHGALIDAVICSSVYFLHASIRRVTVT